MEKNKTKKQSPQLQERKPVRYSKTLRLKQDCYQRMEETNIKYSPEINFINTVAFRRIKTFTLSYQPPKWHTSIT